MECTVQEKVGIDHQRERILGLSTCSYSDRLQIALVRVGLFSADVNPRANLLHREYCDALDEAATPYLDNAEAAPKLTLVVESIVRGFVREKASRPPLDCQALIRLDRTFQEETAGFWRDAEALFLPIGTLDYTERRFPLKLYRGMATMVIFARRGLVPKEYPQDPKALLESYFRHLKNEETRFHDLRRIDFYLKRKFDLIMGPLMRLALARASDEWAPEVGDHQILYAHGITNFSFHSPINPFVEAVALAGRCSRG